MANYQSELQVQVTRWYKMLREEWAGSGCVLSSGNNPLQNLSPRKRDKKSIQDISLQVEDIANRAILALLAQKVYKQAGFEPITDDGIYTASPESKVLAEIQREIIGLSTSLFTARNLVSLQLFDLHISSRAAKRLRKRTGGYYTPSELAAYITAKVFDYSGGLLNGLPLLDPACGSGVFLLEALNLIYKTDPSASPIDMIKNKIYGLDINPDAVRLARLSLLLRIVELGKPVTYDLLAVLEQQIRTGNTLIFHSGNDLKQLSIFNSPEDGVALAELVPFDWQVVWPEVVETGGFKVVLGNPPYIGFNDYSGAEKAYFSHVYSPVYNLKADVLYYFIYRGVELLASGGVLGYVMACFWKDAVYAARLREWLLRNTTLLALDDRREKQLFHEAEVDACLLFLKKEIPATAHHFSFSYEGGNRELAQADMGKAPWAWLRRSPDEEKLLAKMLEYSRPLGQIAQCRTGAQSGLDEVFIVNRQVAEQLENEVLKPAIKSADIFRPGSMEWPGNRFMIYLPQEADLSNFPALAAYLAPFRVALERRLRYRKSFSYYELQWPRTPDVFEASLKLVTPYKAPRNWFALDRQCLYFSTDVVSVVFNPPVEERFVYAVMHFLNSPLSTWQFRSYSKRVGGGQYDYYANPLKKLAVPIPELFSAYPHLTELNLRESEAAELVFDMYGLTPEERELIRKSL
jgi:hypothetical protein